MVDLLLITNDTTQHYCLITHFSRLLSSQTGRNKLYCCRRCLTGFRAIKSLDKHTEYCQEQDAVRVEPLKLGTMLKFKNYKNSMRVPFIVYADFESFNKPIDT